MRSHWLIFASLGRERINSLSVLYSSQMIPTMKRQVSRMSLSSKSATALVLLGILIYPNSAGANNLHQSASTAQGDVHTIFQVQKSDSISSIVKVLSDHLGAATALTPKQKSEIRNILTKGKGNQNFRCTGLSLAGQRESMYRVVTLRAQLVCKYARSVDPSIKTTVQERVIKSKKLNGRVEVAIS